MENEKAARLIEELIAKTRAGRIAWKPTAIDREFVAAIGGDFTVTVSLQPAAGSYERDLYVFELNDDKGRTRVTLSNDSLDGGQYGLPEFYDLARRQALHVDDKIDKLLGELAKL